MLRSLSKGIKPFNSASKSLFLDCTCLWMQHMNTTIQWAQGFCEHFKLMPTLALSLLPPYKAPCQVVNL